MLELLRRRTALLAAAWAASALLLASCGGSDDNEATPAPPPIQSTTLVVGASLSDNGNSCTAAPTSCPPSPPYQKGVYSNGPLWIDTVAAAVGGAAVPSLLGGTNFAFAGARTGPVPGVTAAQSVPNMLLQFNSMLLANNNRISPNALVVVDSSSFANNINDALTMVAANPSQAATIANNVVTSGVTDIVSILNVIYNVGGRNVLVVNVPDVGKTPLVLSLNNPQIAALATQMSAGYNGALQQQIQILLARSDYAVRTLDLFTLLAQAQANPAGFGLTNATAPCFVPPPTGPLLCATPATYLFWDPFHPTYTAGQLMATNALKALGR